FAIRTTTNDPWSVEIYWEQEGLMGVQWPYEVDWYNITWPRNPPRVVYGDTPGDTARVLVPHDLAVELMPFQEPEFNFRMGTGGRSFYAVTSGFALVRYTTADDIWFEVLQAVRHDDTNFFDLTPVDWPIGEELVPLGPPSDCLVFRSQRTNYVRIDHSFLNNLTSWTWSAWICPDGQDAGYVYSEGDPLVTFFIRRENDDALTIGAWHADYPGYWMEFSTPAGILETGCWHFVAAILENGAVGTGKLTVVVDGNFYTGVLQQVHHPDNCQAIIGARSWTPPDGCFDGRIEHLYIWNTALGAQTVWSNRYRPPLGHERYLIAAFPFDDKQGNQVRNRAAPHDGDILGTAEWTWGLRFPNTNDPPWPAFPGFIHDPESNGVYNVYRYAYPDENEPGRTSYVFAVNTGTIEVWWAEASPQTDLPVQVYYPSDVQRYYAVWPQTADVIVIASGQGSRGHQYRDSPWCLEFDGSNDFLWVADDPSLSPTNELTIEAWVFLTETSAVKQLVSKSGSGHGYGLSIAGTSLQPEFWTVDGNYHTVTSGDIPTGSWAHVAVTFKKGGDISLYVNGSVVTQMPAGAAPLSASSSDLFIGEDAASHADHFVGRMDLLRLWGVARSADEIREDMYHPHPESAGGLVAAYLFDDGEGSSVASDDSDYGNYADIHGPSWITPGAPHWTEVDLLMSEPRIYYQNDTNRPGYNPNEEHALLVGTVAYALRNDLNTPDSSEPYVLVDYLNPSNARPAMHVFAVLATNEEYSFSYSAVAGGPILPPMPLSAFPPCTNTYRVSGPAWQDRKKDWWAKAAGDDGGSSNAVMAFYYLMQPGFWFPELAPTAQPPAGTELPWLPHPSSSGGVSGPPVRVSYRIEWPEDVPEMYIAETLTKPTRGLPDIWDQLSVEILYQQSLALSNFTSVTLLDPVVAHGAELDPSVIDAMVDNDLARQELGSSRYRFPSLPPTLYRRIYYDPDRGSNGELVIEGQYVETLTGGGYLLLNFLATNEVQTVLDVGADLGAAQKSQWESAVYNLPTNITPISNNTPFVHAALSAGRGRGYGYVTLAFNNSTNTEQVPEAAPISLAVIKVIPELAPGYL
ncbi:MAG TPA: LamG domain-containing protein, partial [Lentisphaerae bacterium]|nr:LamG domain-containing protein [Lentisphaerota bacterium]